MIALIDGDFLLFICTHQKRDTEINLESVINSADTFLNEILMRVEAQEYLGFLSVSPTFRKILYPEYKINRSSKPLPKFFFELRNYLENNWGFKTKSLYEADDLVNIYKNIHKDTIVVSPDKDLLKLRGLHYNPIKKTFISTTPEEEYLYFWTSMITGDSTDGIKGIEGKGRKFAETLLSDKNDLHNLVFNEYVKHYGEVGGIENFYKNFKLLKILDAHLVTDKDTELFNPIKYDIRRLYENNTEDNGFLGDK